MNEVWKIFDEITRGKKYTLIMRAEKSDGYFYAPIELKGGEPIGEVLTRMQDAYTVVNHMEKGR